MANEKLIEVNHLKTSFFTSAGEVKAVDDVSYYINKEEIIGVVGESGSGKSVTQLSVMQLIPSPPGKIIGGEVLLEGKNLLDYKAGSPEMRSIRGAQISMIFQEPMTSLNPVFTVGYQLTEVIRLHLKLGKKEARKRAIEVLTQVGIPDPEKRMRDYPFQMSGGMRQRVMIALAISCNSKLIVADEPTTALDATIQAQVMELLVSLVKTKRTSLVIVTHNLGLIARYAERIYVMYAGKIVESGTTEDILSDPRHPYTKGLLKSVPRLDDEKSERLIPINGMPPDLAHLPDSCAFLPRCPYSTEKCRCSPVPPLVKVGPNEHYAACCMVDDGKEADGDGK